MLESLVPYLQFGNRFCGIEHASKSGKDIIYATCLKKSKKEVNLEKSFSTQSIKEVSNKLPKKQHIFLTINNEHVLTKSLSNEKLDELKLVNKAFPNIDLSIFYYEILEQGHQNFVSICRKAYVDTIISEYQDNGIFVTNFSLANSLISNIINYIDTSFILTSNAVISVNNSIIESIELKENIKDELYNVNGLNITNSHIVSFSGALSDILKNSKITINNYEDKTKHLLNIFKQVRFFNQFLKIGLVFILGLLLLNFLVFNFYFSELKTLSETSQLNQTTKSKILKLNKYITKAQKTTNDILKNSSSKSSFYVDAISQSLPNSILLTEINYQPLEKRIKEDKEIDLNNNTIIIAGESNNSKQYSEWISELENMKWINKVIVENYSDSKTATSSFTMKISLTP